MNAMYRTTTNIAKFFEPHDIQRQSLFLEAGSIFARVMLVFTLGLGGVLTGLGGGVSNWDPKKREYTVNASNPQISLNLD